MTGRPLARRELVSGSLPIPLATVELRSARITRKAGGGRRIDRPFHAIDILWYNIAMKETIWNHSRGILIFVGSLWAIYFLDLVLPGDWTAWGVVPRTVGGLVGIVASPFLHGSFGHLISNTVPIIVLLFLLQGSRSETWSTVVEIALAGGTLLWLLGRNGTPTEPIVHVGASGLIYGLIAFLIVAGIREKRIASMLAAGAVAVLYGTTLLSGVLPTVTGNVSWDVHLTGALAGAAIAYFTLGEDESSPTEDSLPPT